MGIKSNSSPGLAMFSPTGNGPPIPQPRASQPHVPLTIYNPLCEPDITLDFVFRWDKRILIFHPLFFSSLVPSTMGNNVNGSNSSSSQESVNSKSSRDLNHHPPGRYHHPPERPAHPPEKLNPRSRVPDIRSATSPHFFSLKVLVNRKFSALFLRYGSIGRHLSKGGQGNSSTM